jgi:LacI family transcriptional regulator
MQENTIKDIALELGLSPSTVSRALKDHPHINKETKRKVKEVAAKLGYRYNAMAASLRNSRSNTIGLIIPRISKYYQSAVITAIQNKLQEYKYNVMICQSNESLEVEKELVQALYASRVEGLIVSSTLNTVDFSHFDIFSNSNRPLVFFDRVPKEYAGNKIHGDDHKGGYIATRHLLELGCRRIAFIGGLTCCNLYAQRYNGYTQALHEYGLKPDESLVHFHDLTSENAQVTSRKIFAQAPYPDAVFACNDTTALVVVQHARTLKIPIPTALKVVGYSNDPLAQIIHPSITSIEQYPYRVGEQSAIMMMNLIQQKIKPGNDYLHLDIHVDLIKRRSTVANDEPGIAEKFTPSLLVEQEAGSLIKKLT